MITSDTIAAMKAMASDSRKRPILLKDATCVGGLVIVLSNPDNSIVQDSLETLNLLCECKDAPKVLKNHMGMMDQLDNIITSEAKDSTLQRLAESLRGKLLHNGQNGPALKDISNTSRRSTSSRNSSISSQVKTAKSIVLQLRGLIDKSDRDLCARLLLKVKGVISITFDLSKKRCILRTKLDVQPQTLAASLAKSMTMTAQQVVKGDNGDETFVNFTSGGEEQGAPSETMPQESGDLPEYLSDESDTSFIDDKAMKRPSQEDKKKSASWFSVAANFMTNSFYW